MNNQFYRPIAQKSTQELGTEEHTHYAVVDVYSGEIFRVVNTLEEAEEVMEEVMEENPEAAEEERLGIVAMVVRNLNPAELETLS